LFDRLLSGCLLAFGFFRRRFVLSQWFLRPLSVPAVPPIEQMLLASFSRAHAFDLVLPASREACVLTDQPTNQPTNQPVCDFVSQPCSLFSLLAQEGSTPLHVHCRSPGFPLVEALLRADKLRLNVPNRVRRLLRFVLFFSCAFFFFSLSIASCGLHPQPCSSPFSSFKNRFLYN
jgi:hypothetical protein